MMRCCLLLILFPLIGHAQKFSVADVKQLKLYSGGIFSNEMQAKADTHFVKAGLKVQPIWPKRKDGAWLFAEKTDTGHSYQVWHFYLQDDTTMVMQLLDFKSIQKAEQLSKDIKQEAGLYLNNLLNRHGCEIYLKKSKTGYTGVSWGKDCLANTPGIEYFMFSCAFTKNGIQWQQTAFDKEDKEIVAALKGNYTFIKQVIKSSK